MLLGFFKPNIIRNGLHHEIDENSTQNVDYCNYNITVAFVGIIWCDGQ